MVNDPVFVGCPAGGLVDYGGVGRSRMRLERLSKCQTSCFGGIVSSLVRQTAKMGEAGVALDLQNQDKNPKEGCRIHTL